MTKFSISIILFFIFQQVAIYLLGYVLGRTSFGFSVGMATQYSISGHALIDFANAGIGHILSFLLLLYVSLRPVPQNTANQQSPRPALRRLFDVFLCGVAAICIIASFAQPLTRAAVATGLMRLMHSPSLCRIATTDISLREACIRSTLPAGYTAQEYCDVFSPTEGANKICVSLELQKRPQQFVTPAARLEFCEKARQRDNVSDLIRGDCYTEADVNLPYRNMSRDVPLSRALSVADQDSLFAHGAKPDVRNAEGDTVLLNYIEHYLTGGAIHMQKFSPQAPELISNLLLHGADPNVSDKHGNTPLKSAVMNQLSSDVFKILIEHGANVNFRPDNGDTVTVCEMIVRDNIDYDGISYIRKVCKI